MIGDRARGGGGSCVVRSCVRQLIQLELVEGGGGQPANECADRAREDAAGRLEQIFGFVS